MVIATGFTTTKLIGNVHIEMENCSANNKKTCQILHEHLIYFHYFNDLGFDSKFNSIILK